MGKLGGRPVGPVGDTPLAKLIRNARVDAGLGQGETAKAAGMSPGFLSRIESADRDTISGDAAVGLSLALGLDLLDVLLTAGIVTRAEQRRLRQNIKLPAGKNQGG